MKVWKKLSAMALALMMVLALCAPAFATAENMTGEGGIIGEFQSPNTPDTTAKGTSIVFYKEITAYNPDGTTVNAPAITFNYTISAGDAGKDIYDDESHHTVGGTNVSAHALTKAGVGTPTITGTGAGVLALVPGTNTLQTAATGKANRFPLTVSFDGIFKRTSEGTTTVNFTAGVYRYKIEETTTETVKNASGIVEGSGANTLYMDVYVDGSGDIYGYVLFTNNSDDISAAGETTDDAAATAAGKVEGFVGTVADVTAYTTATDSTADKYYTFDLTVGKTVANDSYSVTTKHQFPFTIVLTNGTVTANVLPIMNISDNSLAAQDTLTAKAIAGTWNPKIAGGGTITYEGIPSGTTVTIKENNDVTGVTYTSASTGADTNAAATSIYTNDDSGTATVNGNATALVIATANYTVDFTNTLIQVSPTGVALRYAPYLAMLGAGVVALPLTLRKKEELF